jgi:hypothetical protein
MVHLPTPISGRFTGEILADSPLDAMRIPGPYRWSARVRRYRRSESSKAAAMTVIPVTAIGAGKLSICTASWSRAAPGRAYQDCSCRVGHCPLNHAAGLCAQAGDAGEPCWLRVLLDDDGRHFRPPVTDMTACVQRAGPRGIYQSGARPRCCPLRDTVTADPPERRRVLPGQSARRQPRYICVTARLVR